MYLCLEIVVIFLLAQIHCIQDNFIDLRFESLFTYIQEKNKYLIQCSII